MHIAIFGTGYVGLVTGTCLAEVGNHVICIDVDADKIAGLQQGRVPIFEPGLEPLVQQNQAAGRMRFTTDPVQAIADAEIIIIAVGTPPGEDGSADLQYVLSVARTIGSHMQQRAIIVGKSTVPVGTRDLVHKTIATHLAERGVDIGFDVVSNPEFLKEGDAVNDCMRPDRIIIGTDSARALERLRVLYAPFNRSHDRIVVMDPRSAELSKYAANAMLATKISFMNEIANIAERVGADVEQVRLGIGSDPRIGYHFIYPGAGYGGSCFPKDVRALQRLASSHGHDSQLLTSVETVNEAQKRRLFAMLDGHFSGALDGLVVALWGLAFKPNTDDMREAPSRVLMEQLWAAGARVRAFDPEARQQAHAVYGDRADLTLCDDPYLALEGADALVIVTEWKEFRSPDWARIIRTLRNPVVFDGRNLFDPAFAEEKGVAYYAIGRGRSVTRPA